MSKKIILLAGPTASGKSRLAIQLANKLNGEIINADSMQIYKEFKILSSRPINKETKKVKHHLYGVISVKKYFSAGDWLKAAKSKINQCLKTKKTPIIVGGTGLYFNTITRGISKIPNIDIKTRSMMNLAMIGALGKMTEWEIHCKGAITNGVSKEEIRAIIHVIGIYCGIPQAMECFRVARKVLEENKML